MSITYRQAADLLVENYADWSYDDPDWWECMVDMLMEFPSVKALRRSEPGVWRIPRWWPGAIKQQTTDPKDETHP